MSDLIPVSRKEQYLSKIDGMTNKSPDKTYTKEEYFFSEILGEALHKPVLETRYEMYLAKIAGREIGIPYPETRLERFLAKAAGMNISVPTPITREEMYWSTYSPFYLSNSSGTSPLTYGKCKIGALSNYQIYGNTVSGESVGDRMGNTLPMSTTPISTNIDDFHCEYDGMGTITLTATKDNANFSSFTIPLKEDFIIPISVGQGGNGCLQFNNDKAYSNDNIAVFLLCFNFNNTQIDAWSLSKVNRITYSYMGMGGRTINNISIEKDGQAVLHLSKGDKLTIQPAFYNNGTTEQAPFEPYGYKVPVTVSNGTDTLTTPIYLPEQIRKVGDETEYIDYGEQKLHRVGAEDIDVTLPALPVLSGTNTLTVGTEVQPSHVFVEFYKEREYG